MKHAAKWAMCLALGMGVASMAMLTSTDANSKPKPATVVAPAAPVDPPMVKSQGGILLSPQGIRFGMSETELVTLYESIIKEDFKPLYAKAQPGPAYNRVASAEAEAVAAFRNSRVPFDNLPTGVDSTPLRGEYSYRNQEMMMKITRKGVNRYFFFIKGKMWKFYDEVPLKENGPLGKDFAEARKKYDDAFRVLGRNVDADFKDRNYNEVDWQDANTHLRVIDRNITVGIVYEERATLNQLASLRTNKAADTDAVDPDIAALVRPPGAPSAPPPADTKGKNKKK